jgi:Ca2+-binding RTX toxin-like protein
MLFGSEGNDTVDAATASLTTIQGGVDSADGGDSIFGSTTGADLVFGNGGADTISVLDGLNTAVGGVGADSMLAGTADDRLFANEGDDTVNAGNGANSVVGGQGNDCLFTGDNNDVVIGSEGNDSIYAQLGADTLTGSSGNDTFYYFATGDQDGNGAAGGAIETITDLNWDEDFVRTVNAGTDFARNYGAAFAGQGTLASAADAAISTAYVEAGAGANEVAAQFTFGGRTFLVADEFGLGSFTDTDDTLIDITGATGTISTTHIT